MLNESMKEEFLWIVFFMQASKIELMGDENVARASLAKNAKLKKFWLDNFLKNHGA